MDTEACRAFNPNELRFAFVCTYGGQIPAMSSEDLWAVTFELERELAGDFSRASWERAVRAVQRKRAPQYLLGSMFLHNELDRQLEAATAPPPRGRPRRNPTRDEIERVLKLRKKGWGYGSIARETAISKRLAQRICENNGI